MRQGVVYTGIPSQAELDNAPGVPTKERLEKGKVAVIECVQEIPCNPCEKSCPFGAISIGENITSLPKLDLDKCTGCGNCLAQCPGLAIFLVDMTYSKTEALVSFPFEYLPLPEAGDIVDASNRAGEIMCKGTVKSIKNLKSYKQTPLIEVSVPIEFANEVRGIKRLK